MLLQKKKRNKMNYLGVKLPEVSRLEYEIEPLQWRMVWISDLAISFYK